MSIKKQKLDIEIDIKKNEHLYTFVQPSGTTSEVWKNFKIVQKDEESVGFVKCNKCKALIKFSPKSGTGGLLRHKCLAKGHVQASVSNFLVNAKISTEAKHIIGEKQLNFIVKDLRPLSVTDGN